MFKRFSTPFFLSAVCLFGICSFNGGLHAERASTHKKALKKDLASPIVDLDVGTYDSFIQSQGIVVVEFYSNRCPPCRWMKAIYNSVAQDLYSQALFGRILSPNALFNQYNVKKVPTFILYRNGVEIKRGGAMTKFELETWIESELP